jgi:hypothetical protein
VSKGTNQHHGRRPRRFFFFLSHLLRRAGRRQEIRGKHCSHGFCKACFDKILLLVDDASSPPPPPKPQMYEPPPGDVGGGDSGNDRDFSDVEISGIPTQGSCPICRARLSLFDVRWVRSNQEVAGEGAANGDEDDDESRRPYGDEIVTDWKRTPLAGKIYGRRRGIGVQSYHFDPADPDFPNVPHVNSSLAAEMLMGEDEEIEEGQDDAAAATPRSNNWKLPIQEFKWHKPSRTMRGVVFDDSPDDDHRGETDEHILSLTSNLYCVRAGAQVTHRTAFASPDDMHRQYPLDGTYRCAVVNEDGSESEATTATQVVARGKAVTLSRAAGVPHVVMVLDPADSKLAIVCPVHISMCRFAPFPFGERPEGPQNGDTIRFYVGGMMGQTALSVEDWTMVRKAAGTVPPPDVEYFVGPTAGAAELTMHYRLWTYAEQLPPVAPRYVRSELWGNAFCQKSEVGLGSYHFVAPSYRGNGSKKIVAYVSFAQSGARRFATLDDGSDLPDRAHFKSATWDASTRTFVASLKWLDDWGALFRGMKRWDVKMRFDSEYVCILGGLIKGYPMNGDATILSVFGKDQLYFNACLDEAFCDLLGIKKEAIDGGSPPHDEFVKSAVETACTELQRARGAESSAPLRIQPLLDRLQAEGGKARALKECRHMFLETCQRVASVSTVGAASDGS